MVGPPTQLKRDFEALRQRRIKAADCFAQGLSPAEVARELSVSIQSAVRWRDTYESGGADALAKRTKPGPHFKLGPRQTVKLQQAFESVPPRWCDPHLRQRWTPRVTQDYVMERFRVGYHRSHCWRLHGQLRPVASVAS
jgi:transposase